MSIATGFGGVRLLTAVGDTTGDGWPDLMGQPKGSGVRIYPGNGVNGLRASYVAHSAVDATRSSAPGGGTPTGRRTTCSAGATSSSSSVATAPAASPAPRDDLHGPHPLRLGAQRDVDRDGRADLVVRGKATGYLWLLSGTSGGYKTRRFLGEGFGGYDLAG